MISSFSLAPNTTGELLVHHNLASSVDVVGSMEEAVSKIRNMSRGAELILQLQWTKDKDSRSKGFNSSKHNCFH